jgi:hypothetical protein
MMAGNMKESLNMVEPSGGLKFALPLLVGEYPTDQTDKGIYVWIQINAFASLRTIISILFRESE